MKLSIIIVTHNNLEYTRECITEIKKYTDDYEIIMIDNASSDGTIEFIKETTDKYILNDHNTGFAHAVNQGLELSEGEYVCLLNNDLLVYRDWSKDLILRLNQLEKDYKVGAVAPIGRGIGNKQDYVQFYGEHGFHEPYTDNYYIFNEGNKVFRNGKYTETKYLTGCCLLMRTELLKVMNGLDENCVCGADDADLSLRLRLKGYKLFVIEDVFVYHYNHKTFISIGHEAEIKLFDKSWNYFNDKWSFLGVSTEKMLYNEEEFYYSNIKNKY